MLYKFRNRDKDNYRGDYLELNSEANTLVFSMISEDFENPIMSKNLEVQLNEQDLEDMLLALTNIQREIFEYKKFK